MRAAAFLLRGRPSCFQKGDEVLSASRSNRRRRRRRSAAILNLLPRRLSPGVVLNTVCSIIIVICLVIGLFQWQAERQRAAEEAERLAAEEAARQEEEAAAAATAAATYDFTVALAGDVNLDDSWPTMTYLAAQEGGISDCIDAGLLERMQSADLFCLNSEFAFTTGGQALDGKAYTFRSDPSNVSIYQTMGVDLVTLANNHIYDFGPEGQTDTLATLDGAGIAHVGAGETLTDAMTPYYWEHDGVTVAFVSACCAEQNRFTPEATADSSGVLLCYETDKFVSAIQTARQNADYVIACVHWGTDYVYEASEQQRADARTYIDAGADVIVGSHSHCLQGIEYYNGKPIFYSLGSGWFNERTLETCLLELRFTGDGNGGEITATVVPAIQENCTTRLTQSEQEAQQVFDLMLEYSFDVNISADGLVTPASAQAEDSSAETGDTTAEASDTTPEDTSPPDEAAS